MDRWTDDRKEAGAPSAHAALALAHAARADVQSLSQAGAAPGHSDHGLARAAELAAAHAPENAKALSRELLYGANEASRPRQPQLPMPPQASGATMQALNAAARLPAAGCTVPSVAASAATRLPAASRAAPSAAALAAARTTRHRIFVPPLPARYSDAILSVPPLVGIGPNAPAPEVIDVTQETASLSAVEYVLPLAAGLVLQAGRTSTISVNASQVVMAGPSTTVMANMSSPSAATVINPSLVNTTGLPQLP